MPIRKADTTNSYDHKLINSLFTLLWREAIYLLLFVYNQLFSSDLIVFKNVCSDLRDLPK